MLKTKSEIKKWLDKYEIRNYTINADLTVDVNDCVFLTSKELVEIPIQFGIVDGNFLCDHNYLTTLKGCPKRITNDFYCQSNKLKNLMHAPKFIGGGMNCSHNPITSLHGFNSEIKKVFYHSYFTETGTKIPELESLYNIQDYRITQLLLQGDVLKSYLIFLNLENTLTKSEKDGSKRLKI